MVTGLHACPRKVSVQTLRTKNKGRVHRFRRLLDFIRTETKLGSTFRDIHANHTSTLSLYFSLTLSHTLIKHRTRPLGDPDFAAPTASTFRPEISPAHLAGLDKLSHMTKSHSPNG